MPTQTQTPFNKGLGPHGDGLLVAGLFFTDYPPSWEKIPPVEDLGDHSNQKKNKKKQGSGQDSPSYG